MGALAPAEADDEVVYGLDLLTTRGLELVYLANKIKMEKEGSTGVGKLVADRPASGPATVVAVVEEEEEEEEEEVEEEEGKPDIIYRLRRLEVIDCIKDSSVSDLGMVGGDGRQLEASQQPSFVSHCDSNFLSISNMQERRRSEQPEEQPRAAAISVVGGDVGTAHRRRERERDKEKEEDKEGERSKTLHPNM